LGYLSAVRVCRFRQHCNHLGRSLRGWLRIQQFPSLLFGFVDSRLNLVRLEVGIAAVESLV
jgi:hypothetical protein